MYLYRRFIRKYTLLFPHIVPYVPNMFQMYYILILNYTME